MKIPFSEFEGAPTVLLFTPEWTLGKESIEDLNAIRDGLEQVGASLIVLSGTGIWSFRPNGDERFEAHDEEIEAEILRLASVYGVGAAGSGASSILVLDSSGKVGFAHTTARDLRSTLAHALSFMRRPPSVSPAVHARKRDITRLIGALSGAFFGPLAEREVPAADAAE
jgi:hypothetical protein